MARKIVLDIIVRYLREGSYLNILLNDRLENTELSRKDKDLITRIVYGTIQNKMYLEYQLAPYLENKKVKPLPQAALLMSAYQICFLNKIPTYAILNEAVALVSEKDRYGGKFVNAILRNYIKDGIRDVKMDSVEEQISIETSHPLWMVKMFSKQYGLEETKKICISNNEIPTRAARVNTLLTKKEDIIKEEGFSDGYLSEDAVLFASGNIANTEYFKKGYLTIQDESSQLVARFLHPNKDEKVLDMCCAPGSKTTHLSAIMENTGEIIAGDIFPHKLKLVENNAKRMHATNITCKQQDGTKLKESYEPESFDSILLDAPCSGFGVLRRKPEIKYHDASAMDTIIPLQLKLLENAYYLLKNNGKMVYSTCTLNKKENELMIKKFIDLYPDMQVIEEKIILPYLYHSDGFYMCKLEKGR
ncbi:MAG: 16S rRNA (cytosine(967)-C(5))-methyltransferase RsmB [Coprobacillaceae bacterium]